MYFEMDFRVKNGRKSFESILRRLLACEWYYGVYERGECFWWTDGPYFYLGAMGAFREQRLFSPQESPARAEAALGRMQSGFSPIIQLAKKKEDVCAYSSCPIMSQTIRAVKRTSVLLCIIKRWTRREFGIKWSKTLFILWRF